MPRTVRVLTDADIKQVTADFIKWAGEPVVKDIERSVKVVKMLSEKQLKLIRCDLPKLLRLTHEKFPSIFDGGLRISALIDRAVVDAIMDHFQSDEMTTHDRKKAGLVGVGPDRMYQIALLLKKILIYLAVRQSAAADHYIPPTHFDTWIQIESGCAEWLKTQGRRK